MFASRKKKSMQLNNYLLSLLGGAFFLLMYYFNNRIEKATYPTEHYVKIYFFAALVICACLFFPRGPLKASAVVPRIRTGPPGF